MSKTIYHLANLWLAFESAYAYSYFNGNITAKAVLVSFCVSYPCVLIASRIMYYPNKKEE